MLETTQAQFRESLKTLLELRLINAGIDGLKIDVLHGGGDLSVRVSGTAEKIFDAQKALRNYGRLIDFQITS